MKTFDTIIIGGGPCGYVAAIQAAKFGGSVALVEAGQVGGTCLNRGCIPSKTLLRHSELIEQIKKAKSWGIETGEISISLDKMMQRKNNVIQRLRTGIQSLLKMNKIELVQGTGTVYPDKSVRIATQHGEQTIQGKSIILATGSIPAVPKIPGIEEAAIHTSDTIFDMTTIPRTMAIVGGGVIAVEFACIFVHLNVEVTIIEMEDRLVPMEDPEASAALLKALKEKGVRILTGHRVQSISSGESGISLDIASESAAVSETFDEVVVAIGRKPNVSGLDQLGLRMDRGYIAVNDRMETSIPGIYAGGDVIGGLQLAHVASAEGVVAAWNATHDVKQTVDYRAVPRCVYTFPEIASVGLSEAEARKQGYDIKKTMYPFHSSGKALAMDETNGFVKVIADKKHGQILGVVIVGAHATEMISEASAFIFMEGTTAEMANMIHPHPSLSEGLFESAAFLEGMGVHM